MSYVYTETDETDLTYFVDHQCQIISRAIKLFLQNFDDVLKSIRDFEQFLFNSGLYRQLTPNQRMVFNVAKSQRNPQFTASSVMANLGCSYNTAAAASNGLVALKLFKKRKDGREWIYSMEDPKSIQKAWV